MPTKNSHETFELDARNLKSFVEDPSNPLSRNSVDVVVTSPPYWSQRDYGHDDQIGEEETLDQYSETIANVVEACRAVLKPTGSLFLNLGDTYVDKSLTAAPASVQQELLERGWLCPNVIQWAKTRSKPTPVQDRLKNTTEKIYWLVPEETTGYVTTPTQFAREYGEGDVWRFPPAQTGSGHAAPYPTDLVERALSLTAPDGVCPECGTPHVVDDPLTADDWGCECECDPTDIPVVYDPFVGTGTTIEAALDRGYNAIGTDLAPEDVDVNDQTSLNQFEAPSTTQD
jgi:DNA modification methylase